GPVRGGGRTGAGSGPSGGEADDGGLGRGEQPDANRGLHRGRQFGDGVPGAGGELQVARVAEAAQGGERRGDGAAGAGGRDDRVDHRVARPVGIGEILREARLLVAVQQDRDALRGVRVFVQ